MHFYATITCVKVHAILAITHIEKWLSCPALRISCRISKQFDKSGFHEFLQRSDFFLAYFN